MRVKRQEEKANSCSWRCPPKNTDGEGRGEEREGEEEREP